MPPVLLYEIHAGPGRDRIITGRGENETIYARDGQRDVICVGGSEGGAVFLDRKDEFRFNCGP